MDSTIVWACVPSLHLVTCQHDLLTVHGVVSGRTVRRRMRRRKCSLFARPATASTTTSASGGRRAGTSTVALAPRAPRAEPPSRPARHRRGPGPGRSHPIPLGAPIRRPTTRCTGGTRRPARRAGYLQSRIMPHATWRLVRGPLGWRAVVSRTSPAALVRVRGDT